MNLSEYVSAIEANLRPGNATEHTHRAALSSLIESLEPGITATNEPKRIAVGAPDYVITRNGSGLDLPVGYIEAKKVGEDLRQVERSEQLKRYLPSLSNLVLTDYLDFRWYLDGELRASASLGAPDSKGAIRRDKAGAEAVRELLGNFLAQSPPHLSSPRDLAERMAGLTHLLRDHVLRVLNGPDEGGLGAQLQAFRRTLVPDLDPEGFADMYAQTVAYGLFAARAATPYAPNFSRYTASQHLPRTNPFLRRFFNEIAGPDLDERVAWLVDALAGLLAVADMSAVLKDFGRRTRREDPVVHFYRDVPREVRPPPAREPGRLLHAGACGLLHGALRGQADRESARQATGADRPAHRRARPRARHRHVPVRRDTAHLRGVRRAQRPRLLAGLRG